MEASYRKLSSLIIPPIRWMSSVGKVESVGREHWADGDGRC